MILGYVQEKDALSEGFTHHASYFGIPVYFRDYDNGVWCKHPILDPVFDLFTFIEGAMRQVMFPDEDPVFQFKIKQEINGGN